MNDLDLDFRTACFSREQNHRNCNRSLYQQQGKKQGQTAMRFHGPPKCLLPSPPGTHRETVLTIRLSVGYPIL